MSFNDFMHEYNFKNEANSNIKIFQVISPNELDHVSIYLRDGPFSSDVPIVNLHPSKGTHWVPYINEKYFDSFACGPQKNCLRSL